MNNTDDYLETRDYFYQCLIGSYGFTAKVLLECILKYPQLVTDKYYRSHDIGSVPAIQICLLFADITVLEVLCIAKSNLDLITFDSYVVSSIKQEKINMLLDYGFDFNKMHYHQNTLLHISVTQKWHNITKRLIREGADVNRENYFGMSPLELSIKHGLYSACKEIMDSGRANPNQFRIMNLLYLRVIHDKDLHEERLACIEYVLYSNKFNPTILRKKLAKVSPTIISYFPENKYPIINRRKRKRT